MSRVGASIATLLGKKVLQCYEMAYINIDGGVYITNAPRDISYDGHTWLSLGNFLGFSNVEETSKFQVSNITVSLSGIPAYDDSNSSFIAQFLAYDYVDKDVEIYRAFFDNDVFEDAIMIFKGKIDNPIINDNPGDDLIMAVETVNNWTDYDRRAGRHTNDNEQQAFFSGDLFFEYAADTIKDIKWAPPS